MSQHHRQAGWTKTSPKLRARIKAGAAIQPCIRCGRPIVIATDLWDVGHVNDLMDPGDHSQTGPEHRKCNRSAGGKRGAALTHQTRRSAQRRPSW